MNHKGNREAKCKEGLGVSQLSITITKQLRQSIQEGEEAGGGGEKEEEWRKRWGVILAHSTKGPSL